MRLDSHVLRSILAAAFVSFSTANLTAQPLREVVISVPGIPGPYCAYGVEKRLLELAVVERVRLLWEEEEIRATLKPDGALSQAELKALMVRADYPYDYKITIK